MIENFVRGKTAVFIDASNIYFSEKTLGWHIDFKKLPEYFKKIQILAGLLSIVLLIRKMEMRENFMISLKLLVMPLSIKRLNLLKMIKTKFTVATTKGT